MTYLPTAILDSLGIISLVGGGIIILFSKKSRANDTAGNELIAKLTQLREADKEDFTKRIGILELQHTQNTNAIADLQGQIKTLRDIPLQSLAETMKSISKDTKANALSNAEILKTLKRSAIIAATDRSDLLNPSQNVTEQHVEHQTIEVAEKR